MSQPAVMLNRQWNPEGYAPLPRLRTFIVRRPSPLSDEQVEATGLAIENSGGVLSFSELVYEKNPITGEPEMLRFVRRVFRIWLDVEEVVGGIPMTTMIAQ